MSKIVYLHLGQHKTGTSSIQNWLWGHRSELSAEGYLLPETGVANGAHHGIFYAFQGIKNHSKPEELLTALRDEIRASSADRVIVTTEEFERFTIPMVAALVQHFTEFDLRPVLYVRRQDSYLLSDYGQQIKMGAALGPFDSYIDNPTFPERFNLLGLIGAWLTSGLLSEGQITVYDAIGSQSVVEHFCGLVGLSDLVACLPPYTARSNTSWSFEEVDLIRRISIKLRSEHQLKAHQVQAVYSQNFETLRKLCLGPATKLLPTQKQQNKIAKQYQNVNAHAARLANLEVAQAQCLTFRTNTDRILTEPPELATEAQINEGVKLVLDAVKDDKA